MTERIKKLTVILFFAVVIGATYAFINIRTGMGIPCLFNLKTGLLCPGCGVTRMICSLIMLDFEKAFYYNALMFILLPVFMYYIIKSAYLYIKNGKTVFSKADNIILYIIIALMIIFAVVRNIK